MKKGLLRNAIEGYELPLTCDILVDDLNWVVCTVKGKRFRKDVYDGKRMCSFPGDFFESYHNNVTHRTIDQMIGI
jgi:hypothetical protein